MNNTVSYFEEVKLTGWKAKAKECKKCSDGGGGPITIERECEPKTAEYSCNGVKTMMESLDCVNYCGTPKSGMIKAQDFLCRFEGRVENAKLLRSGSEGGSIMRRSK